MVDAVSHLFETSQGNVEYFDVGEGLPTLYFHGTGAGNDAALLLEQSLLNSGCRLIIPNRPGYGRTTLGREGTVEFSATLALELLDELEIERAIVIGTSGGGMPAAWFARQHPERTAGLILQCAQSHKWNHGRWMPQGMGKTLILFQHRIFRSLLRWQNMRQARKNCRNPRQCIQQMSGERYSELREQNDVLRTITELTSMTLACAAKPTGIQNDWAILVEENGITKESIFCPTLIIHDRADPLVPFAHAEWSASCIPHAKQLDIRAGGHLIWFGKDFESMHDQRLSFIRQSLVK